MCVDEIHRVLIGNPYALIGQNVAWFALIIVIVAMGNVIRIGGRDEANTHFKTTLLRGILFWMPISASMICLLISAAFASITSWQTRLTFVGAGAVLGLISLLVILSRRQVGDEPRSE